MVRISINVQFQRHTFRSNIRIFLRFNKIYFILRNGIPADIGNKNIIPLFINNI